MTDLDQDALERRAAGGFEEERERDDDAAAARARVRGGAAWRFDAVLTHVERTYRPFLAGFVVATVLYAAVQPFTSVKRVAADESVNETDSEGCRYTALSRLRRLGVAS